MNPEIQILNNYISILEKTNQQLSFLYNPYGLMVGILTLLIAVIAIAVSYALWSNSKEQRDRINKFFAEQEKIIKEKNDNVQRIESKLNDLIKEYEKQLKSTTKGKKEIQKIIDELKIEKAQIGSYIGPALTTMTIAGSEQPFNYYSGPLSVFNKGYMICTQCGKKFSYYRDRDDIALYAVISGDKNVYCPFCGTKNIPQ